MSDSSDHLLYVLTARREMAWSTFKQVFEILYEARGLAEPAVAEARPRRTSTIRSLQALAHCDFVFSEAGSRAFIAPAVLSRLPIGGLPKAILSGARSPQTISQLQQASSDHGSVVHIEQQSINGGLIPARICVEAKSPSDISAVAATLGILVESVPPAWSLANLARHLDEVFGHVKWEQGSELTWARRDFDERALQFGFKPPATNELRLSRYLNPTKGTFLHWLWRGDSHAAIDCDWGRYAVLHESGKNVLYYDERSLDFATPRGAPLPKLLSRALCLCSGYAPRNIAAEIIPWRSTAAEGYDIYSGVPLRIAELVAKAIGQSLIPHPIGPTIA
jgi:hypothetical protein